MTDTSGITAGRGVVRAFLLPLADRLAGNPDALTGAEIEQLLGRFPTTQNENASATLDDLRHLFAEIERSRYAAGGAVAPTLPPEKVRSLFDRWSALLLTLPPKQLARLSEERGAAYQPSGMKNLPLVLLALILPLGIVGCRSADSDTEAQFAEAIRLFNEADQAEANPAGGKGAEASEGDASEGVAPAEVASDKGASEGDAQALFLKSAAVYEGMMHAGTVSGPILYNQGNAYWRGGQPARALAAWRKAEAFLPSDPYLKANIDLAVSHAAVKRPFLDTLFFWQRKIAVPTIGLISIFCAALTGFGILAWFLTDRALRRRKIVRRATLAAAALFAVFSASFFVEQARFAPNRHAILSTESVLRKGASATYEPVLRDKLPALTELELRDRRDGWLELALPDGTVGYLAESDAEVW